MNHETVQDAASDTDELPAASPDKMDDLINAVATPLPNAAPSKATKPQYSQRARLREETEAPFRKARMFVYAGSTASAGVGAFIAGLRIIAALIGVSGTQPLNETVRHRSGVMFDDFCRGACCELTFVSPRFAFDM